MGMKTPTHTHTHKGSVPLYPRVWVSGTGTGVQNPCGFTPGVSYVIGKFHVPSTIDNYAHKKYYYSNLSIHCLCLITGSLLNVISLDQTKFAPLHYHYNDRGYLSMLFSCFRVLLKVIATNQRNSKMVLSKHVVKICMSYDPNKNVMCEKFFLTLSPMCLGSVVYCL